MTEKFTCHACKLEFEKSSDFDGVAEAVEMWGALPEPEVRVTLCDDCFRKMTDFYNTNGWPSEPIERGGMI